MSAGLWYAQGIRFTCTRCQACCTEESDGARVILSADELHRIAMTLGCRRDELPLLPGGTALEVGAKGCPLHDGQGCTVYEARPRQCDTWPFWPENIYSREAWERRVLSRCPGAGVGRLWTRDEVESAARRARASG